ncbi:MAG: RNA polymerase sigma factor [Candidatus Omnitrophica bacterium]|nr:RNA polymerase sigma factor [Candidatus Omnitrophota bacterium]
MTQNSDSLEITEQGLRDSLIKEPHHFWLVFWEKYGRLICSKVNSFHFSADDAQDVLQEISLYLLREDFKVLRNWDPKRSRLSTFLCVIAVSRCIDFKKKRDRSRNREVTSAGSESEETEILDLMQSEDPSPEDRLQRVEKTEMVINAIHDLCQNGKIKPIDRQILQLRLLGKPAQEIATLVDMNESAVNKRFFRAKQVLVARLENLGLDESD